MTTRDLETPRHVAVPDRPPAAVTDRAADWALRAIGAVAPAFLRIALGLVFVWFGALKVFGVSPVRSLLVATFPGIDPAVLLPVLGGIEVVLGLCVLVGRLRRVALLLLAAHLCGTFVTFALVPQLTVQHGNPLLLTTDGEFVMKNLVLIGAALVLVGVRPWRAGEPVR